MRGSGNLCPDQANVTGHVVRSLHDAKRWLKDAEHRFLGARFGVPDLLGLDTYGPFDPIELCVVVDCFGPRHDVFKEADGPSLQVQSRFRPAWLAAGRAASRFDRYGSGWLAVHPLTEASSAAIPAGPM